MQTEPIAIAIQTGIPVMLWGPPGCGKSSAIEQMAAKLSLPCEVVIASIREPSDFAGLPVIRPDGVELEPPRWARRLSTVKRGLLVLDELSCAPPSVQAALLRVVLDRVVGDLELPRGISVIAAANPPHQAAGGWDLSAPMANRFLHLTWTPDAEIWSVGITSGWQVRAPKLPGDWHDGLIRARALVAAFCRVRPALLCAVPREESEAGRAWPSPRTWDMAARLIAAVDSLGHRKQIKHILVEGCIGSAATLEFLSWEAEQDLPDPEVVLADPDSWDPPERHDRLFAALGAVVGAVVNKMDQDRWLAGWKAIARGGAIAIDVAAVAARTLAINRPAGVPAPEEATKFLPLIREAKS